MVGVARLPAEARWLVPGEPHTATTSRSLGGEDRLLISLPPLLLVVWSVLMSLLPEPADPLLVVVAASERSLSLPAVVEAAAVTTCALW